VNVAAIDVAVVSTVGRWIVKPSEVARNASELG